MNLQQSILEDGLKHNMCEKFQKLLTERELSADELCMLYHKGLDFCIEKNWPEKSVFEAFEPSERERNGIYYAEKNRRVEAKQNTVVLNGSDLTVVIPSFGVVSLTVLDQSNVKIICEENSFCYVSAHHDCSVEVIAKDATARISASVFGGHVNPDKFNKVTYKK